MCERACNWYNCHTKISWTNRNDVFHFWLVFIIIVCSIFVPCAFWSTEDAYSTAQSEPQLYIYAESGLVNVNAPHDVWYAELCTEQFIVVTEYSLFSVINNVYMCSSVCVCVCMRVSKQKKGRIKWKNDDYVSRWLWTSVIELDTIYLFSLSRSFTPNSFTRCGPNLLFYFPFYARNGPQTYNECVFIFCLHIEHISPPNDFLFLFSVHHYWHARSDNFKIVKSFFHTHNTHTHLFITRYGYADSSSFGTRIFRLRAPAQ